MPEKRCVDSSNYEREKKDCDPSTVAIVVCDDDKIDPSSSCRKTTPDAMNGSGDRIDRLSSSSSGESPAVAAGSEAQMDAVAPEKEEVVRSERREEDRVGDVVEAPTWQEDDGGDNVVEAPTWHDGKERSPRPGTSKDSTGAIRKREAEKKRGKYVTRALKTRLKKRLERERLVSLSESSSEDSPAGAGYDEFDELDTSILNEVIRMVEREEERERAERGASPLHEHQCSSPELQEMTDSSTDEEVVLDNAILNLLVKDKTYNTPVQMNDDIINEVVRRTRDAGERAARWGADELGGPGTLKKLWLVLKNKERLRGVKREAEESVCSNLSTPERRMSRVWKRARRSLNLSDTCSMIGNINFDDAGGDDEKEVEVLRDGYDDESPSIPALTDSSLSDFDFEFELERSPAVDLDLEPEELLPVDLDWVCTCACARGCNYADDSNLLETRACGLRCVCADDSNLFETTRGSKQVGEKLGGSSIAPAQQVTRDVGEKFGVSSIKPAEIAGEESVGEKSGVSSIKPAEQENEEMEMEAPTWQGEMEGNEFGGNVVEAPTWQVGTDGGNWLGGNVVEAPTWQSREEGEEDWEDPTWHGRGESVQISIMDNDPDLERGQGFSWDRVVQCEVCLEGGNQHTCDANVSVEVETIFDEEEVVMLILNEEDIKQVDREMDEQSD